MFVGLQESAGPLCYRRASSQNRGCREGNRLCAHRHAASSERMIQDSSRPHASTNYACDLFPSRKASFKERGLFPHPTAAHRSSSAASQPATSGIVSNTLHTIPIAIVNIVSFWHGEKLSGSTPEASSLIEMSASLHLQGGVVNGYVTCVCVPRLVP